MFQRGHRNAFLHRVNRASPEQAIATLRDEFDGTLSAITSTEDRERIYRTFLQTVATMHQKPMRITLEALTALFMIVTVLVLCETRGALRVSNIL